MVWEKYPRRDRDCQLSPPVLEHTSVALKRKAHAANARLEWDIPEDLPEVFCDPEKAGRVTSNLAINALKFCGEAGVVRIAAQADVVSQEVTIAISDNGPGIDEESRIRIFNRFKQLAKGAHSKTKGFGLGLSIAKELVDLNFGSMDVESVLGEGSVFSFTIPFSNAVEVVHRYLRRLERAEDVDDCSAAVSIVTTSFDPATEEAMVNDVDAFLNFCQRKHDLLFRISSHAWFVALPNPACELDGYFQSVRDEFQEFNRNRAAGPLPEFQLQTIGSWRLQTDQQRILNGVSELTVAMEAPV